MTLCIYAITTTNILFILKSWHVMMNNDEYQCNYIRD